MSEQSEREAYNEAAREYHEGKEREEMDRPMFTQRDLDAAVQGEREVICSKLCELRTEVDCRIDHGANHGGHLDYVRDALDRILKGIDVCSECDGERWHEYKNPLTGEITNRTPCSTCNGDEEVPGPSPAVDVSPRGVWRCECCGEMFDGISPEWRMSAGQMAHKCPGNDPQAGYFTARFFPDARPAVDVISEDFAVTMKTIATVYEERDRVMAVVREWRDAEAEWVAVHENPSTVFNDERRERIIAVNDRHARSRIALRALVDGKGEVKDGGAKS